LKSSGAGPFLAVLEAKGHSKGMESRHEKQHTSVRCLAAGGPAVHAQRHNFATALSVSVANVKTAQDLLRHSDPRLTLGIYTHGVPEHERAAIENLPNLIEPVEQAAKMTGTDEQDVFDSSLDSSLHKQGVLSRTGLDYSGQYHPVKTAHPASKNVILAGKSDYPRRGSNAQPLAPEANALSN